MPLNEPETHEAEGPEYLPLCTKCGQPVYQLPSGRWVHQ
jgi:hypothetical protein